MKAMSFSIPFNMKVTWREKGVELTPVRWHLYLGEPDEKKRVQITLIDYKSKSGIVNVNIGANAYLCIGNELPGNGQLPPINPTISKFLNGGANGGVDTGADAGKAQRGRNKAVKALLLTGDNEAAARAISAEVGISDVRANLLPEDKMRIIKDYAGGSEPVCMVGDGVNDALALSTADAGVAMGGIGSDIAIESADAVLVSDEIKRLPYLFSLTRQVMQKVRVNIIASLIINITAVVLSAMGVLTPVTGALWHNCGSVFVVVNAALLLRLKDEN